MIEENKSKMMTAVPVLPVRDTQKSAKFYEDKLGFRIIHVDLDYAIISRDSIEIHLWSAQDESWKERELSRPIISGAESFLAGTASCRVKLYNIDRLCQIYQLAGVLYPNGALTDKSYGLREFSILDVDGNLITFFQRNTD